MAQLLELICPDAVFILACVLVCLLPETAPEFLHALAFLYACPRHRVICFNSKIISASDQSQRQEASDFGIWRMRYSQKGSARQSTLFAAPTASMCCE